MPPKKPNFPQGYYTQGYSKAAVASHASRTMESDASFLIPHLRPSNRILDVGCGPGTITVGFGTIATEGSVVGVDISEEVIELAQKTLDRAKTKARLSCSRLGPITFQTADILVGLPFPDNSFDVVFSSQLFPHLPTPDMRARALGEMRRVLRPRGFLASRDVAELHFYPRVYDLDRLLAARLARVYGHGDEGAHFPGGDMPALFFDVLGFDDTGDIKVGAGTTVHAGREARKWYVSTNLEKLEPGNSFRESWHRVGITDEEIQEVRDVLETWGKDDDAWYVALHAEILGRK